MPKPRKALVLLEETPYYHCISRCVRRAFLCGVDTHSGKSYEHRRQWIVDRMKLLADLFAIDLCAYAVMSNHYHVILHVDSESATQWCEQEVIERWEQLFSLPVIVQRYLARESLTQAERDTVSELITKWRKRLHDISWYMRCLNEPIARQANQEDGCTGVLSARPPIRYSRKTTLKIAQSRLFSRLSRKLIIKTAHSSAFF